MSLFRRDECNLFEVLINFWLETRTMQFLFFAPCVDVLNRWDDKNEVLLKAIILKFDFQFNLIQRICGRRSEDYVEIINPSTKLCLTHFQFLLLTLYYFALNANDNWVSGSKNYYLTMRAPHEKNWFWLKISKNLCAPAWRWKFLL